MERRVAIQLRATPERIEKEELVFGELVLGARIRGAEHDTLVRGAEDVRHAPGVAVDGHRLRQGVHPLAIGRVERLTEGGVRRERWGFIAGGGRLTPDGRESDQQGNEARAKRHAGSRC